MARLWRNRKRLPRDRTRLLRNTRNADHFDPRYRVERMAEENERQGQVDIKLDPTPRNQTPSRIAAALQRDHSEWVSEVAEALGETTITVPREFIVNVCEELKTNPEFAFNFLADLGGFDRGPEEEPRF